MTQRQTAERRALSKLPGDHRRDADRHRGCSEVGVTAGDLLNDAMWQRFTSGCLLDEAPRTPACSAVQMR